MKQMTKAHFFAVTAITLDGFIARYSGHKSIWTSKEDKVHLHKMEDESDALFLASKSYEIAKKFLKKRKCIVMTRKVNGVQKQHDKLTFINPQKYPLEKFVKKQGYKKICVLGGRAAYNYCLQKNLLDDIFLTIEPIVFGNGITMFDKTVKAKKFKLVSLKRLNKKGAIMLHYSKSK